MSQRATFELRVLHAGLMYSTSLKLPGFMQSILDPPTQYLYRQTLTSLPFKEN